MIMQIVGVVCSILYAVLFIYSGFHIFNFSYFFISIFLFVSSITPYTVDIKNSLKNISNIQNDVIEERVYYVNSEINFLRLTKYLSMNTFSVFRFVDSRNLVIGEYGQDKILKCIDEGNYFFK